MLTIFAKSPSDTPRKTDGFRVLIDRRYPRASRADLSIDIWVPELAPSARLCRWLARAGSQWSEFCRRYEWELLDHAKQRRLREVLAMANDEQAMTLVCTEHDAAHTPATVLKQILERLEWRESRKAKESAQKRVS